MAISKFKKLIIISHKEDQDRLLDKVHKLGAIEIIKPQGFKDESFSKKPRLPQREDLDAILEELQCSIDFIKGMDVKKSLLERLTEKRPVLDFNKVKQIIGEFDYSLFCKEVEELEGAKKELEIKRGKLLKTKDELLPWQKLDIPLQEIGYTEHTLSHIGTIRKDKFPQFNEELTKAVPELLVEEIDSTQTLIFLYVLYLRSEEEKVSVVLKRHGFDYVYLTDFKGTPNEILKAIDDELAELDRNEQRLLETGRRLLQRKDEVFVLYDYFSNLKKRELMSENFLYTDETFVMEGWLRERDVKNISSELRNSFKNIELIIRPPSKTDKVPVELENKRIFEPFEFITNIYGLPAYHEVDPTPFLAPFFFLFFGFCLSDAGYGIIVSLLCWFVLKRFTQPLRAGAGFRLGPQAQRFFRLFFYCGISTAVLGILTGSCFGNFVDVMAETWPGLFLPIKNVKDAMTLLNPQRQPMKLLIIALSLGVVHLWFGHIVAIYGNLKNKRFLDALFDQGSILLFLSGFTGLLLGFFGVFGKSAMSVFLKIFILGSLFIVLTQGRSNPGIGSKLFFGLYSWYSTFSGYISDILSYSRLWALGLVTGVMAYTCNLMAFMIGGLVPYVGVLFTILILVFGHIFTLLMNLLGAFVHPVRLQFVEFFSKFFRGGGRRFRPLRIETRYTVRGGI